MEKDLPSVHIQLQGLPNAQQGLKHLAHLLFFPGLHLKGNLEMKELLSQTNSYQRCCITSRYFAHYPMPCMVFQHAYEYLIQLKKHLTIDGYLGYFCVFGLVNDIAINIVIEISLFHTYFHFFVYTPSSDTTGSHGNSICFVCF